MQNRQFPRLRRSLVRPRMAPVPSMEQKRLGIGLIAGERKGVLAEAIYSISQRFRRPDKTECVGVPAMVHRRVSRFG